MTLKKVLGVGDVRRWLYLAAKVLGVSPARCCLVPSLQWAVVPFGGCEAPRTWIFDGELTVRVTGTGSPRTQLLGARACPKMGYEVGP
jgi:hypothetical protein